jgi:hypothetical protein
VEERPFMAVKRSKSDVFLAPQARAQTRRSRFQECAQPALKDVNILRPAFPYRKHLPA